MKKLKGHPKKEWLKLLFFKGIFLTYTIVLPILFVSSWQYVVTGFFILNISAGIIISIALVSSHVGDHHEFPTPDENNELPYSWAEHQLATTSDFCTKNKFFNLIFGGFNHHTVHHLFPISIISIIATSPQS